MKRSEMFRLPVASINPFGKARRQGELSGVPIQNLGGEGGREENSLVISRGEGSFSLRIVRRRRRKRCLSYREASFGAVLPFSAARQAQFGANLRHPPFRTHTRKRGFPREGGFGGDWLGKPSSLGRHEMFLRTSSMRPISSFFIAISRLCKYVALHLNCTQWMLIKSGPRRDARKGGEERGKLV